MNIYEIQEELLAAYDELEANGGELSPELEEKLSITQEEFKNKIKDYTNLIKSLEYDMKECKEEMARIKKFYDRKEKLHDKLEEILVKAINEFGETKKSGVKYVDYGTGSVSIRKSTAVDVNEDFVKTFKDYISGHITFEQECNQLDVYDRLSEDVIIADMCRLTDRGVSLKDVENINIDLGVSIPFGDLVNAVGYTALKEIVKYTDQYKLSVSVPKSSLKPMLEENGSCMPNLAKLKQNESLIIK